jgi:hypothetical protein
MVFSFLSSKKRVQSKSSKRVSRKQRNKTSKRRVSRRSQRGGFQADLASAYPAGGPKEAFEGDELEGGEEAFEGNFGGQDKETFVANAPQKGGMGKGPPLSKGGHGKGPAPSKGGMGKGPAPSKGGAHKRSRSGRKSYATVPVLTAAALTAAHFYGPGAKSRKNHRKSRKNRSQRRK